MKLNNNKLEEILFEVQVWKIPFYDLIGGKINLLEFEQKIYSSPELETLFGEETYVDLISFNFSNSHIYNEVIRFILENILVGESEYHCKLCSLIGEFYLTDVESKIDKAKSLPEAVISIFEGAHIFPKWTGVDYPACDVQFSQKTRCLNPSERDCRNTLPSSTVSIGYACNRDIEILMDDDGHVYIYLHIIDQLHYGGKFLRALEILFFGLDYGELLCPSKRR